MKRYIAEGFGTGVLTLAILASLAGQLGIPTPVMAGLTLGILVYMLGTISGCHLNPAVTIGLWSINKIEGRPALGYVVSQFVGALVARGLAGFFFIAPQAGGGEATLAVGLAELIGTLIFTVGIASVAFERVPASASGVVIGGSLMLGASIATMGSAGVLNPAVALGANTLTTMYVLGPIVGAAIGMRLYKYLSGNH